MSETISCELCLAPVTTDRIHQLHETLMCKACYDRAFNAYVRIAKAQVALDITAGILPPDLKSLSDAHDYTDANYYGLFTDASMTTWVTTFLHDWCESEEDLPEDLQYFSNDIQEALATWIEEGMPA